MIMLAVFHELQRQANLYALALRANAYEKTGFKDFLLYWYDW